MLGWCAFGGLATAAGCSAPDQAPGLGNAILGDSDAQVPDGGYDFGFDGSPPKRMCNLGPDAGVCACLDVPLLTDVPNMYFVLDRSGSMSEFNKWTTAIKVVGDVVLKLGPRASYGIATFPDPRTNQCAPGIEVMSTRRGDSPAGSTTGPTYQMLAATLDAIGPNGGTPTAATFNDLLGSIKQLPGRTYVILATDGGPNCNAGIMCSIDQCIANIESAAPGCAPAQPPNCCDPGYYGEVNCLDSAATTAAVAAYAAANIPVYVIGVYGSGPYAVLLDQLAQAGGTARSSEPLYYRVDGTDEASLQAALYQVAAKITATCTFVLKDTPDPTLVNVFLDDVVVPEDPVNGWSISGNTVTLLGSTCDKVSTGQVIEVHISAGCPTVVR